MDPIMNFNETTFLTSAAKLNQLPADTGNEVAFAGRSNVGKSSTLNAITGCKSIARTSKTPGRTRLINFFTVIENCRLVDLPGYGYAKVSKTIKEQWQKTLSAYLNKRQSLYGLILIIDIRHLLKEVDYDMICWAIDGNLPIHLLLNKADKLGRSQQNTAMFQLKKQLTKFDSDLLSYQLFSATSKLGIDEARNIIARWLGVD